MVKLTLKKLDGTVVEKLVEKPRYGGIFSWRYPAGPSYFDLTRGQPPGAAIAGFGRAPGVAGPDAAARRTRPGPGRAVLGPIR